MGRSARNLTPRVEKFLRELPVGELVSYEKAALLVYPAGVYPMDDPAKACHSILRDLKSQRPDIRSRIVALRGEGLILKEAI